MSTRALFIDALGTTVRLLPPWERIDPRAVEGVPPERVEAAFRLEMAHYKAHAHEAVDAESLATLRADCAAILSRELGYEIAPMTMMNAIQFEAYPDAQPALTAARDAGLRIVCVSNWDYELPSVLADVGLAGSFDAVLTSAAAGARKPDPAIFNRALVIGGWSPSEAVHVGDSDDDVAGAVAAGIPVLRLDREGSGGDISSLDELMPRITAPGGLAEAERSRLAKLPPSAPPVTAADPSTGPPPPPPPQAQPAASGNWFTRFAGLPVAKWNAMGVMLGVLIAFAVLIAGSVVVAIFDPDVESEAARDAIQLVVAIAFAGTALGFALSEAGGRLRDALPKLGIGRITWTIVGIAAAGWAAYLVCAAILVPLLQPEQQDVTRELGTDTDSAISLIVAGFLIVVIAPLSEELFFRGFMFAGLRRSMPFWGAALISGLIFGSLHLSGGNVGVAVQLALLGVILAYLYERSGSLWAPIMAHTLNNAIAFTLLVTDTL